MKFTMRVTRLGKEIADFEFRIEDARESEQKRLFEIERFLNERTDVRVHINTMMDNE